MHDVFQLHGVHAPDAREAVLINTTKKGVFALARRGSLAWLSEFASYFTHTLCDARTSTLVLLLSDENMNSPASR